MAATFLDLHKAQKRVMRALAGLSPMDARDVILRAERDISAQEHSGEPAPSADRPSAGPVPQCEETFAEGMRCGLYAGHTGFHRPGVER